MNYALIGATILDGTEQMVPFQSAIVVENGRITKLCEEKDVPADYKKIDLTGKYVMPGLINLHVHLPGSGMPKDTKQQNAKSVQKLLSNPLSRKVVKMLCQGYAKTELLSGVTTIRTVGGLADIDSSIRDGIDAGKTVGPRMLTSDMAVSVPGGHMAGVLAYEATSEADCVRYVDEIAKNHPNLIKLMITGGVLDAKVKGEPGVLRMKPEFVKACCEEAHKLGFRVAAHVESTEGVRVALENGVDTIEHGAVLDEALIALFKERKACHVCTISPAIPLALFDESVSHATDLTKFNGNIVLNGIVSCAKTCLAEHIPVGLGTDTACPFVTHYDMWRELVYFCHYTGVTPAFAIHTATQLNARIAGIEQETGSIETGKSADLLIVDSNPLEDLTVLRKPYLVVIRGKMLKQPKIKKFPLVEAELDKYLAQ